MENESAVAVIPPIEKPKRPSREDPLVLKQAAEKLAVKIEQWEDDFDGGENLPEDEKQKEHNRLIDALIEAMQYGDEDGYDLADKLHSRLYIDPDAQLVEILDDAGHYKYNAYNALLKQWVIDNNIVSPFKVGDKVIYYKKEYRFQKGEPLDGEITSIQPETATCTVFVESEGHVRKGLGTHGHIVAYEDIGVKTTEPVTEAV